jgi:hypothetical protein
MDAKVTFYFYPPDARGGTLYADGYELISGVSESETTCIFAGATHVFTYSKPGYNTGSYSLYCDLQGDYSYTFILSQPGCGYVQTSPAESTVFINGVQKGTGWVQEWICLDPGTYTFKAEYPGYLPATETRTVVAGETFRTVDLVCQDPGETQGCGYVNISPAESIVFINGVQQGTAWVEGLICLDPGAYTFRAEYPGYIPATETRTVVAGETFPTVDLVCQDPSGGGCANVKFTVNPSGTLLTLNGASIPTGTTVCVPAGNYVAHYALSGYVPKDDNIVIKQEWVDDGLTHEYTTTLYTSTENACHETGTARVHAEVKFIVLPAGSKITMGGTVLTENSQASGTYVCVPVGVNTVKYEHAGYTTKTDSVTVTPAMALTTQTYEHVINLTQAACSPACNATLQKCDTTKTPASCICASPCPTGTTCVKTSCVDTTHACSTQYPNGFCTTGTCVNGKCSGATTTCDGLNRNGSFDPTCILETGNEMYLYGAIGAIALLLMMKNR